MRSRLAALTALGALVAVPTLATAATSQHGGSLSGVLSSTHDVLGNATGAVAGLAPLQLSGARVLGRADSTTTQRVTLALALRDASGLDALMRNQQAAGSADYHRYLTPEQFAARFGPSTDTVAAARAWATSAGLAVTDVSDNRTLVTLSGSRAALEQAFGVRLMSVRAADGQVFTTPDRTATLPAALRAATTSVLGLSTYQAMHLPTHRATAKTGASPYQPYGTASYGPRDFWRIYDAPSTTTGRGQTLAVITQGDLTQVKKDLVTFESRNALPRVPVTVVQVGKTSTDTSGAEEYDLDTQYSTGFAPDASSLRLYNSATLGDIGPLNKFVTERTARTASASYGGCEVLNQALGVVKADDQVFKQAVAQGQSFWFSSGDTGSMCSAVIPNTGLPTGIPNVEYPSSSAYVVAVGGTTLTGQSSQPLREVSWVGGGGGYSLAEKAPSWQKASGEFNPAVGRGVPDVSLDADPNSGYTVVVAGQNTTIGGTSASTPAWNGIWARVLQRHPGLGFAAPSLYRTPSAAFTDITLGSNGLFAATSGYDLTTGLGSSDIAKLVSLAR